MTLTRTHCVAILLCVLLACAALPARVGSSVVPAAGAADAKPSGPRVAVAASVRKRRFPKRRGFGGGGGGDDDEEEQEQEDDDNDDNDDDTFFDSDGDGDVDGDDFEDGVDVDGDGDSDFCFPASAEVTLADGRAVAMADLAVGDRVRAAVGGAVSDVFMFTHAVRDGSFPFVRIATRSGHAVALSAGHYIYASGALVPAAAVRNGDTLEVLGAAASEVVDVSRVRMRGLYNPQTLHGDIVVNGVRASTYTTAVPPAVAHTILVPFRAAWSALGLDASAGLLDNGASAALALVRG